MGGSAWEGAHRKRLGISGEVTTGGMPTPNPGGPAECQPLTPGGPPTCGTANPCGTPILVEYAHPSPECQPLLNPCSTTAQPLGEWPRLPQPLRNAHPWESLCREDVRRAVAGLVGEGYRGVFLVEGPPLLPSSLTVEGVHPTPEGTQVSSKRASTSQHALMSSQSSKHD